MNEFCSIIKNQWLIFVLLIFVAYPNPALAKEFKKKQPKQTTQTTQSKPAQPLGGNEKITGAFRIKFGEDIKPYLEGHYSNEIINIPELTVSANSLKYKILKPPINVKEYFPGIQYADLLGFSDENDLVLILDFTGSWGSFTGSWGSTSQICGKNSLGPVILEALRDKYKIKRTIANNYGWREEYTDEDNNEVIFECKGGSFSVKYTSHLLSNYIERLKAAQQIQKEKTKKSLEGF